MLLGSLLMKKYRKGDDFNGFITRKIINIKVDDIKLWFYNCIMG